MQRSSRGFSRPKIARRVILPARYIIAALAMPRAAGNPTGMVVQSGVAAVRAESTRTTITVSDRAVLNWGSFNIGRGETTQFVQPSNTSIVWNQIKDANPSQILGSLVANGRVVLANEKGFYFGKDSFVGAAGFAAITTAQPPPGFSFGGDWVMGLEPPSAGILNEGVIQSHSGGFVYLLGNRIENKGDLRAGEGQVVLGGGREVQVCERPDGRGLAMKAQLDSGHIDNSGRIIADAGEIALRAEVVNQGGTLQAKSFRMVKGIIQVVAADEIRIAPSSKIVADGDESGVSPGGKVVLKAERVLRDAEGSTISVRGGGNGGDAGSVEYSAPDVPALASKIDGRAKPGYRGAELLIDPDTIVISSLGGTASSGSVDASGPPGQLVFNPSAFSEFSSISLQARKDILINNTWTLRDLDAGQSGTLSLLAGGDIRVATAAAIQAGTGWSLSLSVGYDFATGMTRPGVGSVMLTGGGVISARNGSVEVVAGKDVTVGTGAIRTTVGGKITVSAGGNINTGTRPDGFVFRPSGVGYEPIETLGGISTAAGGDVTLTAGGDVISLLPTQSNINHSDGGTGAFGSANGNVTISAGRSVFGHYVLRNGMGTINAVASAGEQNRQLALSLSSGTWKVNAQDIVLQEVRNPNGVFNRTGTQLTPTPTRFAYDYAPDARVELVAANRVSLLGAAIPRLPNLAIPIIYAPNLHIEAGAGGIVMGTDVTLFPSPTGQLTIRTRDSGALASTELLEPRRLSMSDSAARRYDFKSGRFGVDDHDPAILHRMDASVIDIDVSGDVQGIKFGFPKAASVRVGGDLLGSSIVGQNIRQTDVTTVTVRGEIRNRNDYTFITLPVDSAPVDMTLLGLAYPPLAGISFVYDRTTRELGLRGRMTENQRLSLKQLQVQVLDVQGRPIILPDGEPLLKPAEFVKPEVLDALFNASQDVPREPGDGYQFGGPGRVELSANKIDLGVTPGIVSYGARKNAGLVDCNLHGADVVVHAEESITLFSSAIASIAGGNLLVTSNGSIDVGTQRDLGVTDSARGIYTSAKADVDVIAVGNIELNGSRIAAYDGGNVHVRSELGNINAGAGGLGFARVDQFQVQGPDCIPVVVRKAIPGSGILATTFPGSDSNLGNVTVETPRGDIIASSGGIAQVSLGTSPAPGGKVKLLAGTRDADGKVVHQGKIDASNSGVIGSDIKLDATGDIKGVVFSRGDLDIVTPQSVTVTALAGGSANVSAGGGVSGTIVGIGSASVTGGGNIDASVLSNNSSVSGTVQGQVGFTQAAVAGTASQGTTTESQTKSVAAASPAAEVVNVDNRKKPRLGRSTGRVRVLLDAGERR